MNKNLLEIKNISKNFNNKTVLKNINLTITPGERIAILGANGTGKTTLVEIIAQINAASGGTINYYFSNDKIKENIGIQIQESNWPNNFTIKTIINFYLNVYKKVNNKVINDLLINLDLKNLMAKTAKKLSPGQKQRLNLLLALSHNPELLILDEPTSGLDLPLQKFIINYLKKTLINNQQTLLLVSHNLEEISKLCTRIVIIKNHEIIIDTKISSIQGNLDNFIENNL